MDIESVVEQLERQCQGRLSFVFQNFSDGTKLAHQPAVVIPSASVIKLPMLVHIAMSVEEGLLTWEMPLMLTETSKSSGMGVLKGLTTGLQLTLRDACYLMTVLSDNTATNMIIEHFGVEPFNTRFNNLGFSHTRLVEPASHGLSTTTAHEMANLLQRLIAGTLCGPTATAAIRAMLVEQQDRVGIPRYLPATWIYAGKTGANPDLRADVGIITSPDQHHYVLSIFCHDLPPIAWTADNVDNPGLLAIARLAQQLLISPSITS